ncbi:hypothetical protein UPYG_G00012700 [Umbra pygmaea]|uniref:SEFIR domain-containing protein n=1 Tax=Umbra pygmaea TaxID=75934 RepID=A0ABD0XLL6_UMBPY
MRTLIFIIFSRLLNAQSHPSIRVTCKPLDDMLLGPGPIPDASPSPVHKLFADVTPGDSGNFFLNISWAINIDKSIYSLTGTLIVVESDTYQCLYEPNFEEYDLTGLEQLWFHHLVPVESGFTLGITALNLPAPATGQSPPSVTCTIPFPHAIATTPISLPTTILTSVTTDVEVELASLPVVCVGCLAVVLALVACFLTLYKVYGPRKTLPFIVLPNAPEASVSVLIVYPAGNPVFQRAVMAFAEVLQSQGGCKVAIDMWQLGRLAKQGLMRWLAEQVKSADRVMVISPQPNCYHTDPSEDAVPAAAHDLFPLVLHMVASHARSPSELAKFWVVHLCKATKSSLPVELRSCRNFSLMQDWEKIVTNLHQKQGSKIPWLKLGSGSAYWENLTEKLRDAVLQLEAWQTSQVVQEDAFVGL